MLSFYSEFGAVSLEIAQKAKPSEIFSFLTLSDS